MMDASRGLLDLIIARVPALSSRDRIYLAGKFDRAEEFTRLSREDVYAVCGKPPPGKSWTMDGLASQADRDALTLRRNGILVACFRGMDYPGQLRDLHDPPAQIFYRGALPEIPGPFAAIVGTRKPTGGGQLAAHEAARFLGRNGVAVVSGLALGIDALAHRGNISGGGRTVAVLGSGPDRIYPVSNRDLARRILTAGGAILSEYPPGTEPFRWNFPARNRIIAALSRGVLVVEAPEKSGALITAELALDLGRDVWVHRTGFQSLRGGGVRRLAEEGAQVIEDGAFILEEWGMGDRGREDAGRPEPAGNVSKFPDA